MEISEGDHRIDVWFDRNHFGDAPLLNLCWRPPGEPMETIPRENLVPFLGGYGPGTPFPENHP